MNSLLPETHPSTSPDSNNTTILLQRIAIFSSIGLFTLACVYTLYFAKTILIPIVVALLFSFLLSPIIRRLKKLWIPQQLGAAFVIIVFFSIFSLGFYKLSTPVAQWMSNSTQTLNQVSQKLTNLSQPFQKSLKSLFKIQAQIEQSTEIISAPETKKIQIVQIKPVSIFNIMVSNTWQFFIQLAFVVFLLYFLLVSDNFFLRKLIEVLPHLEEKKEMVTIFYEIENKIYHFFILKILTSLALALTISVAMWALHMKAPIFWGVAAGILEFFPYIGVLIGTVAISLAAVLVYDNLGQVVLVPTIFFMICSFVGNFVSPLVVGRSFLLHPVIIFIGMVFWGWIWGVTGALIAIPMLSILKIIFENIKSLKPLSKFLGE